MPVHCAPEQLHQVTVPLRLLIPQQKQHYFTPDAEPVPFTRRAFDFWGQTRLMPLVHAFLRSCTTGQHEEFRYLFDLLGSELATNAMRHTRSGEPGATYTLRADRHPGGITLTCRDNGSPGLRIWDRRDRRHLTARWPEPAGEAESGRGLALIDALATSWGDNGFPTHRHVWFFLAYDLTNSAWDAA
ncbi:histidine kinase-like protein [Haloactinospora alba]|uniref:Histidine kinase-like protein n=1 Tax=Haloactinospora alba TaxID=405555 RepID=A0A543N9B8_9ACTN|nr:ATP-binding protein [Haloactinospora alba]TQN28432.1 histidine kinase-like protein [Haloactinospora alba]